MEKRTVLAIVVSIVFILIWQKMVVDKMAPPEKPVPKTVSQTVADQGKSPVKKTDALSEKTENAEVPVAGTPVKSDISSPSDLTGKDFPEQRVTLENQFLKLVFTNKGARLISIQIKQYTDESGKVMELVNPSMSARSLTPFSTEGKLAYLNRIGFAVESHGNQVRFFYEDGGRRLEKVFSLIGGYRLKVSLQSSGFGDVPLSLGPGIDSAEKSHSRYSTEDTVVVYTADDGIDRIKKKNLNNNTLVKKGLDWVAIEDKYFVKIFLPEVKGLKIFGKTQSYKGEKKDLKLSDVLVSGQQIQGTVFLGPKDYDLLKKLGHHFDKIVNFGFFGVFAKWLFFALRWINGWVHNYGWSIILLTILIRLLIFPISQAGLKSMKDMQRVQPKMKAIQEKYKKYGKDLTKKQEMNREIQELYKKEGVSPLGGCLPMILQMPIFFAFWSLLLNVIELRHAPFLFWIRDLSAYDPYYVLPVLMGLTQLISQMITPSTGDANQKKMMYALPIVFTVVLATAPSGLIVYWTTNNLFQIVQQALVNKSMKEAVEA